MKIAFFELEPWEQEIITKQLQGQELSFYAGPLTESFDFGQLQDVEAISVFIYSKISQGVVDKLPDLKFIATRSTGYDHIDLEVCKNRGILVSNVPSYGENTVAEHTFALILTMARKIVPSVEKTRLGNFDLTGLRGFDLKGKTIGIIGLGRIGAHVARIAYGFEMKILGYDPFPNMELAQKYGISYTSFDELLGNSDLITFHLPLTDQTRHIFNIGKLGVIKRGVYIINTSRGGLIETTALVRALNENIVAGAALDVLEDESNIKEELEVLSPNFPTGQLLTDIANNILIKDDRVIITPHNAFNSEEALSRIIHTTVENLNSHIENNPTNLVG